MRYLTKTLVMLAMITLSGYTYSQCGAPVPLLCDADGNREVDLHDIGAISLASGTPAIGPGDIRDIDGDGVITLLDVRQCVAQCSLSECIATANLVEELSGGNGVFMGEGTAPNLQEAGYVEHEYVASGTATSYQEAAPLTEDGRWVFETNGTAPYRTRVLVRRPENPAAFSGTVIVEWLNVSGGLDANPDYANLKEELTRQGHVWVGVSAQLIGIEGGPVLVIAPGGEGLAGEGLKSIDSERYGSLGHPGDGFSFDIFTQVARALRSGGPAMGYMEPQQLIAAGQSQSAMAMVTYYNGVQPFAQAFDGFFVHSRAFVGLPLVGPDEHADLLGGFSTTPAILRTDLDTPVLELQAENDVIGVLSSITVRQPDSSTFRLWEVAGTAHADARLIGIAAAGLDCGAPINDGPMHFVAKAAFSSLDNWVRTGELPAMAQRLETPGDPPEFLRDVDGIAQGGIRTPPLDVPIDTHSGVPGPNPDFICILLGSTLPLSSERLGEMYTSPNDYEQLYEAATDAVIEAGFVLEQERQALQALADPSRVPN
jgi:hypothetical protein